MIKLKLNDYSVKIREDGYRLNPSEQYVIKLENEKEFQMAIYAAFKMIDYPPAIKNYHAWLYENGFSYKAPDPTNECVASYYGKKPLWKTAYSQGVVVKCEEDDDYYIVMECSNLNKGYKYTQIILTLGGCN